MHGIGGQGVAVTADLLGLAAVRDRLWAHSFPFFGTEIRGGSVSAYTRISQEPIHTRSFIYAADMVVVFASYLLHPGVVQELRDDSIVIVNAKSGNGDLDTIGKGRVYAINADDLASSIPNCRMSNGVLLGAITAISKRVSLESVEKAIQAKFSSETAWTTIQAARLGFHHAMESEHEYGSSLV